MTKKHFIALADAMRGTCENWADSPRSPERQQWLNDVDAVAGVCARFNGRFDSDVFHGYITGTCGPSGGAVKAKKAK